MKKIFVLFLIVLNVFILASCINDKEDNQELESGQLNQILNEYKNKNYLTIVEETKGVTSNGENVDAVRTTQVDVTDNYTYSKISCGNKEGYVYQKGNAFYTKMNENEDKKTIPDTKDVFRSLGFSTLFTTTGFTFTNHLSKKNITSPEIDNYKLLFDNVNFDLDRNDAYNPSILKVLIEIENNKIQKIEFDLSLVYGSFFQNLTRTVTFVYEKFSKAEIEDNFKENTKYSVQTSNTLDTYVIEMVHEFGDAIYIKSGDFDMLIDCGQYQDGVNVDKMLRKYCLDKTLDVLIATHGHADHLGGFGNGALDSIEAVRLIIDFGYLDNNCNEYTSVRNQYISKGSDYYAASECIKQKNGASKVYRFSEDLSLEVLDTGQYAEKGETLSSAGYGAENDFSVVVKVTFGTNTYLYTGDLAGQLNHVFTNRLKEEDIQDITVYKAAHHGANSHNSNNTEFLNYINPQICVSSAAIINQNIPYDHSLYGETVYQHPRPVFVRRILNTPKIQKTKQYYFNGTMGTIHIEDNGVDTPNVSGLGATRGYKMNNEWVVGEDNLRFVDTQMYQSYYLN